MDIDSIALNTPERLINDKVVLGEMIKLGPVYIANLQIDNSNVNEKILEIVCSCYNEQDLFDYILNLNNKVLNINTAIRIIHMTRYSSILSFLIKDRKIKIENSQEFYKRERDYCDEYKIREYLVPNKPLCMKEKYNLSDKEVKGFKSYFAVVGIIILIAVGYKTLLSMSIVYNEDLANSSIMMLRNIGLSSLTENRLILNIVVSVSLYLYNLFLPLMLYFLLIGISPDVYLIIKEKFKEHK